jgi:formylmethanofuran dehydrogenase subunit B
MRITSFVICAHVKGFLDNCQSRFLPPLVTGVCDSGATAIKADGLKAGGTVLIYAGVWANLAPRARACRQSWGNTSRRRRAFFSASKRGATTLP